ncbi:MAG: hypothetical protein HQL42_17960 [Alphaproteobacteria bacterium]|nr:hypothetical protein [Alphaproteobacteria bacterium]
MNKRTAFLTVVTAMIGGAVLAGAVVNPAPAASTKDAKTLCDRINARAAEAGSAQALLLLDSLSGRLGCDPVPFAEYVLNKR